MPMSFRISADLTPPGCSSRSPKLVRLENSAAESTARQYQSAVWALLLHVCLLATLWAATGRRLIERPIVELAVELVTEIPEPSQEATPHDHPIAPPRPSQAQEKRSEKDRPAEPPDAVPKAGASRASPPVLQSKSILADPRSKQAREVLSRTDSMERATQICNLEAMAQLNGRGASRQSDFVNAEATAPVELRGLEIEASGAAYRSHDRWFRLRFTCKLDQSLSEVVDLQLAAGAPIPRRDWEKYSLMIDDHPMHD